MSVLFSFSTFFFFYQNLPKCISKCLQVQAEVKNGSADISVFMLFVGAISIYYGLRQSYQGLVLFQLEVRAEATRLSSSLAIHMLHLDKLME